MNPLEILIFVFLIAGIIGYHAQKYNEKEINKILSKYSKQSNTE